MEKTHQFHQPYYLAFIHFENVFDTVKSWKKVREWRSRTGTTKQRQTQNNMEGRNKLGVDCDKDDEDAIILTKIMKE